MHRHAPTIVQAAFLCAIMALLVLFRSQLNATAGHMDEYDYLYVGKTLLAGKDWPTHSYIFGWDVSWLAYGWGEAVFGGLAGARIIAAVLGLLSLLGMYAFVYALWQCRNTALLAAMLLGFESAHLYTSALATYDIISFAAFVWALPAIVYLCHGTRRALMLTLIACTLLCLSVLSKYVAIIYLPFIFVVVVWRAPLYALLGAVYISFILGSYVFLHWDQLQVLLENQVFGAHKQNATATDILLRISRQQAVIFLLGLASICYIFVRQRKTLPLIGLLLLGSMPMCLYHFHSQNVISLQKHLVFASLFLIPIVAWGFIQLINKQQASIRGAVLALCILCLYIQYNSHTLGIMRTSFPEMVAIESFAKTIEPDKSVLSEDPYLFRYSLIENKKQSLIAETSWLDNNLDGLHEQRDVKQAVWDHKFDYVFLNDQIHKALNTSLRDMLSQRNYTVIIDQRYELQTMSGKSRSGRLSLYAKNPDIDNAANDH